MSKRSGLIGAVVALLAVLAFTASASAYQFTIQDPSGLLTPTQTTAIERAISWQVNAKVAEFWPVDPVSFVPSGGIPIDVSSSLSTVQSVCENDAAFGCHDDGVLDNGYGRDGLWIIVNGAASGTPRYQATSRYIDHEVVETEVDPQANRLLDGQLVEICDQANTAYAGTGGLMLQDFDLPAYFTHATGPKTFLAWREAQWMVRHRRAVRAALHRRHHRHTR